MNLNVIDLGHAGVAFKLFQMHRCKILHENGRFSKRVDMNLSAQTCR